MEIKTFCHPKTRPRPLFLEGRAEVPSIGRTSVPACHYDVNRGRLTYLRGLRGVYNVFQKTKLLHNVIPQ